MTRFFPASLFSVVAVLVLIGCAEAPDTASSLADTTTADVPSTDVYLATMTVEDGTVRVGDPVNVTQRAGYDNQPHFTPDGSALLYTSIRDDEQADTYRYDVVDGTTHQMTDTPESEYSPTPHGDGFSVVRVEDDGTQRLWQFAFDESAPTRLLPDVEPVGYHAWVTDDRVVLFVLGESPTLQLAHVRSGAVDTLARDIGRSLQAVPGRAATISFVQHTSDSTAQIYMLDADGPATEPLVETLPGGDEHAWTPGGLLLMAQDSVLYQHDPERDDGWQRVANLAPLRDVTRLAVHPNGDRFALVAAADTLTE